MISPGPSARALGPGKIAPATLVRRQNMEESHLRSLTASAGIVYAGAGHQPRQWNDKPVRLRQLLEEGAFDCAACPQLLHGRVPMDPRLCRDLAPTRFDRVHSSSLDWDRFNDKITWLYGLRQARQLSPKSVKSPSHPSQNQPQPYAYRLT